MLLLVGAEAVAAVDYSRWASGTRPFTLSAFVAVGVPVALAGPVAVPGSGSSGSRRPGRTVLVARWALVGRHLFARYTLPR